MDLQKIGKALGDKREENHLSVNDISDTLCIRKDLIRGIEAGDWRILPHQVYVKGYIKKYASILGISDEINTMLNEEDSPPVSMAVDDSAVLPSQKELGVSKKRRFRKRLLLYPLVALVVLAFFVLEEMRNERQLEPVKVENTGHTTSALNQTQPIYEIPLTKKLMITCHERTWVSVVIDNTEKKEFMLNPNEVVILNAQEEFDLLIGNAGGVELFLNGKNTEFTGMKGEVKRIKLS